jgi:hypothetical protein
MVEVAYNWAHHEYEAGDGPFPETPEASATSFAELTASCGKLPTVVAKVSSGGSLRNAWPVLQSRHLR